MNVLINHCWCSDSNWGGNYDCSVIVGIYRIPRGETYDGTPSNDWIKLVEQTKDGRGEITIRLKRKVLEWLELNVRDRNHKPWSSFRTELSLKKGWSVGTDEYNGKDILSLSIFFERRKDAMNFIKYWSEYKKPLSYLNYFKDIRKEFDFKTKTLRRVPR